MKQVILETWVGLSVFIWVINALSLVMLPQAMWDWFHLIGYFVGTSLNFGIALNVLLNYVNKLNKI
jgi:hypothetical protein